MNAPTIVNPNKKIYELILIVSQLIFSSLLVNAQSTQKFQVTDNFGQGEGTFNIVYFINKVDGGEKIFGGDAPKVDLSLASSAEFGLRIRQLEWDDTDQKAPLSFSDNTVKISPKELLEIMPFEKKVIHPFNSEAKYPKVIDLVFRVKEPFLESQIFEVELGYSISNNQKTPIKTSVLVKGIPKKASVDISTVTSKKSGSNIVTRDNANIIKQENHENVDNTVEKAWQITSKLDVQKLREFIENFESNEYAQQNNYITFAERYISTLEEEIWINTVKKNRLSDYNKYVELFPKGKYIKEAKRKGIKKLNQKKDQEEILWDEIEFSDMKIDFEQYLTRYPDGRFKIDAEAAILALSPVKCELIHEESIEGERLFTYSISNMVSPKLITPSINDQIEYDISELDNGQLNVVVYEANQYNCLIRDAARPEKEFLITIDATLKAKLDIEQDSIFIFEILGGIPPYQLNFIKEKDKASDVQDYILNQIPDEENKVTLTLSGLEKEGLRGVYKKVKILDNNGIVSVDINKVNNVPLEIQVNSVRQNYWMIIGIPLLILFAGAAFFYFNRKKQKTESYKVRVIYEERQKEEKLKIESEKKNLIAMSLQSRTTSDNMPERSSKIKLTLKENPKKIITTAAFNKIVSKKAFRAINLDSMWTDSTISDIYLSKQCGKDLSSFLKEENLDAIIEEKIGLIPEIGGFLMGNYSFNQKTEKYRVTLEKFIPFVPEYHDVYKIEIGTRTLVQELADAQDNFKDLTVIGWFHTHPGHGLFLSKPDLSVQKHFPQKFQLAMEIDSLTERLDTAFFTRKSSGNMNNYEDRLSNGWFSWKEINKG